MHRPSSTALSARARTLLEHMHEREHWIYALPNDPSVVLRVARATALAMTQRDDLEVVFVEARGEEAALALAQVLAETGFFAQSALLESAHDVETEDAQKALLTLAHMTVFWDSAWGELFAVHLDHESDEVRANAVGALVVAARASGGAAQIATMLETARVRERVSSLQGALGDALAALRDPAAHERQR